MIRIFTYFKDMNSENSNERYDWIRSHLGQQYITSVEKEHKKANYYIPIMPNFEKEELERFKEDKSKWCSVLHYDGISYYFKDEKIALLFKLTWGGR